MQQTSCPICVQRNSAHVGLIDIPAAADAVPARPGGVNEQRREALNPPEHGHVSDIDSALGQEFLDIAIGEPETEVPPQTAYGEATDPRD